MYMKIPTAGLDLNTLRKNNNKLASVNPTNPILS